VTVENTVTTAGGSDEETDEQYRYRFWLAIESFSTCGPRDAYEFLALTAHPDIMQCVVYSAPDIAGEVHLYPLLKGGQLPTQPILDRVLAICSADTKRPVTDYVFAHAPTPYIYKLNMDYWVEEDNEVLLDTIKGNVEQAVADWILWQRSYVSRDLNCDELRKRCLEAGAKRILVHTPTPTFQVMAYNQLACHDETAGNEPVINFVALEEA
jgi:phage-related baseplate assembly protein